MKLSKCESGHFYDSDKYPECPYCNTELLKDHSIVHEGEAEQPAAVDKAAPAGPVAGWLVVLDGAWPRAVTCGWASAAAFWGWTPTARRLP